MKIAVSVASQRLTLSDDDGRILREYRASTGKAGVGEESGSLRTPRGRHLIRAKIGGGAPENTIFVRRRPTGFQAVSPFASIAARRRFSSSSLIAR